MPSQTFQEAIDTAWPDIKATRNKAWGSIATGLVLSLGLGLIAQSIGWSGLIIFFVGFILTGFVAIWVTSTVVSSTRPLAAKVLDVSGLTHTEDAVDMAPLRGAGLVPTTENSRLNDRTFVDVGVYRVDRAELSLYDTRRVKDRDHHISYFGGYVIMIKGLPPQTPITLLRPATKRGFKRLRKFMMAHVDPSMRQEETIEHARLGHVSVFGDGAWNEENILSANALACVETFSAIDQLIDPKTEKCLSACFGPDFCAVAITASRSRLKIGGLFVTKAKVTNNVGAALARLQRTLTIAEKLIVHTTRDQTKVPDGS